MIEFIGVVRPSLPVTTFIKLPSGKITSLTTSSVIVAILSKCGSVESSQRTPITNTSKREILVIKPERNRRCALFKPTSNENAIIMPQNASVQKVMKQSDSIKTPKLTINLIPTPTALKDAHC